MADETRSNQPEHGGEYPQYSQQQPPQEQAHTYQWPSASHVQTQYMPATSQEPPMSRGGVTGKMIAGVAVLALGVGVVSGGLGGYVGYELGSNNPSSSLTALDQPKPARNAESAPQGSVQQVAQKVLPSVVQLQIPGVGEGSGIVLSQDGYILTNNHVAEGASRGNMIAQFNDNRTASVRVVGLDPSSDLAVVKADITGLTPAELGRSDDLQVGAQVVAVGSPFGLTGTVTSGIVSAKDRPVTASGDAGGQDTVLNALQTDAAINPGNSGGPLVDMDGRVVGINSAIYSPGSQGQSGSVGLGFSIPIDQARRVAQELKNTGHATKATLGVSVSTQKGTGAQLLHIVPGGAAEKAGLRPGDQVTKIGDRVIHDGNDLVATIRSYAPGDKITLTVKSGGRERTVDVVLSGERVGR